MHEIAPADPSSLAIACAGGSVSYGELSSWVNHLSKQLMDRGVAAEVVVALWLPRSAERIAAMLAIWRAGGAVLALDPAWPKQRLQAIVDNSGVGLCVTLKGVVPDCNLPCLEMERIDATVAGGLHLHDAFATWTLPPERLAYVVYTSGSTGKPKGVEITHGNLNHLTHWHIEQFALVAVDRVSHIAGLGFDAAFWEVWPALCAGATLVLPDEDTRFSASRLHHWLIEERISCAFVPTVLAELLFGFIWPANADLRILLTGGEALRRTPPPDLPFLVFNNYGPSECAVVSTSGLVLPDTNGDVPSIGAPIRGVQVHLRDEDGNPVQDGEAGEIFIGGPNVGRGYRGEPQLTEAHFIPHDGGGTPVSRLYRSGDIGRRLPDGSIAFLGRIDDQEQIRGVRVEPAEVAHILAQHPDVEWCAVQGSDLGNGRELHAHILLRPGTSPSGDNLSKFLRNMLPGAMVPSRFFSIAEIPLTSSGKLDRDALVLSDQTRPLAALDFRSPANPVEIRIAAIIGSLLGNLRIGCDDNFFLLGGHSLLGAQVVMRIREAFDVAITLREMFASPTVGQLATIVTQLLMDRLDSMTDEEYAIWKAG